MTFSDTHSPVWNFSRDKKGKWNTGRKKDWGRPEVKEKGIWGKAWALRLSE